MKKGFTLVEILVATGIFLVVVTIAMMAFLNVSSLMRKASTIRSVNDSIGFAMETMVREIRTGYNYCNVSPCSSSSFYFTNREDININYYLNGTNIRVDKGGTIFDLTSPDVIIDNLEFIVNGSNPGDGLQPMVIIIIQGRSREGDIETKLNIQSIVTQRKIDS